MKKTRHAQNTLPHSLGELELRVMASVWRLPGIEAKQVQERLAQRQHSSLSTIQSTLERLVRKGLLDRHKRGHAFVYTACVSRAELLGRLLKDVIGLLHDGNPDTILSSFVNAASRIDTTALDQLEQMIQRKRREQSEEQDDD